MTQRKVLNTGYVRLEQQTTSTPVFIFHIKAPLFILNQLHELHLGTFKRIHSHKFEFYIPPYFYDQTGKPVSNELCNQLYTKFQNFHIWLYNFYRKLMEIPVHPQHLEILLPQTLFTEFSLRINIIEFQQFLLTYRNSPSQELHQYLQAMNDLVVEAAPWTSDILKGN